MQDYLYSVIGLIAIAVHLIINFRVMFNTRRDKAQKASGKYRFLMLSIFVYYITDALWGILAGLNWIPLLFVDTTIYYIAMSSAVVCFYRYITEYLNMSKKWSVFCTSLGVGFFVLENISLIINFFVRCFFWFDETDAYVAGPIRYIALWAQVVMFALSSVITFVAVCRTKAVNRRRFLAIFFFSLSMFVAILFQEKYPLLPFYALGCLIGSCILHVYVVGDELDESRQQVTTEKEKLQNTATQLSNYKRAVLSDALISLEANLSRDELYYGVWKDDNGNEVSSESILGMTLPCSYDRYIEAWNERFVRGSGSIVFSEKTDREHLLELFESGQTEITFDYEAKTISGKKAWLRRSIAMIRSQSGDVIAFTSVKDITVLVEQTKREEAYIHALAIEYDSIAVVELNEDKMKDKVVLHSRLTENIISLIDNETVAEKYYSKKLALMGRFVHPEDREQFLLNTRRETVFASFAEGKTHNVDFRISRPEGGYLYYRLRFIPIRDEDGKPVKTITCMRNVDDEIRRELDARRELENARIAAESSSRAKSSFLFNMSHDIRTPMNAIIGFTDIAEKYINDQDRVLDALKKVKMSSNHLLMLINDVLDMSRVESGTVKLNEEPINIDVAKDNLYSILNGNAQEKNILFTSEISPALTHHWIWVDRLLVMRVLTNIISNSIKYTNPGGKVELYAEELPCDTPGRARFRYTVSDTGIGMSEEFLSHVFEPFSRAESATKSGVTGTGLGMAITKSLVELMGGTIVIESKLNVGTTVRVELENRIAPPQDPADGLPARDEVNLAGKKILLVEDNELNREIAAEILEDEGILLDTAEDGDIAVEKMKNAKPGQYDLILMDIQMPRMNGYDATRAIRALPVPYASSIPIIAMTANAFDEDKQNAFAAGMNGHIAKPIDVAKLLGTLSAILNSEAAQRPPKSSRASRA